MNERKMHEQQLLILEAQVHPLSLGSTLHPLVATCQLSHRISYFKLTITEGQ